MAAAKEPKKGSPKRVSFQVSTASRPEFEGELVAHVFDANEELLETAQVKSGKVELGLPEKDVRRARVFLAPSSEDLDTESLTPARLERLGAYEPILRPGSEGWIDRIAIPGDILDLWPLCFCRVRGRVVRSSDGRPVCGARVHVCEVDRLPRWVLRLPDPDLLRLRDDLLDALRDPPIPQPRPLPDPSPRPLFRLENTGPRVNLDPRPELWRSLPAPTRSIELSPELSMRLQSPSTAVVRDALARNHQLIVPWLCIWPWWWWRFQCDEVAVRTTDDQGRFEAVILYPCSGDKPDLYFWIEFDFGGGHETVYHPPIACNTRWDYACGSEVTLRVSDSRVPACGGAEDLPGCQVVIQSIGPGIAVRELQTAAAGPGSEGLTNSGQPLGGTLEPRVEFSRTCLIETKDIPFYRWSYRRLSGPDGVAAVPVAGWTPLTRDVYRHYDAGDGTYPSITLGPLPTTGTDPAPLANLFRIPPADPPAGSDGWSIWNEHVDLASAYFETGGLPGTPAHGPSGDTPAPDDLAAGRYEVKFELFDDDGNVVNWTDQGIDLRITEQDAPFGAPTITTESAPAYNRILDPGSGDTLGFRMVLRVDNNYCFADIHPVSGDVPPDPACGFHEYASGSDQARLTFVARHPNRFATYGFGTRRASEPSDIAAASTHGVAGDPGNDGFTRTAAFTYQKNVSVSTLLGACEQAAFSERLNVTPMVTNGYSTINGYRDDDVAAFALAKPCEPCECDDEDGQGAGGGVGGGRGRGGGGGQGNR